MGDVIKEVDGVEVKDPEQLSDMLRRAKGSMTFKIIPSNWDQNARSHVRPLHPLRPLQSSCDVIATLMCLFVCFRYI